MEEVIARTKRGLYIGTYIICIFLSLFLIVFGAITGVIIGKELPEFAVMGWVLLAMGCIILVASVCWLVYFIKMPQVAVSYKDGKLNFMNKVECTPTEIESWKTSDHGLDGVIFNFGKLFIVINGKKYKFKFIDNVIAVPQRLYALKMEAAMKAEIAKKAVEEAEEKAGEPVKQEIKSEATASVAEEEKTEIPAEESKTEE